MPPSQRNFVQIGAQNRLKIVKEVEFGVYLDGNEYDTILLPKRYVPENAQIGDTLDVFLYLDSDDKLIATTLTPKVQVGQCAYLEVTDVNDAGTFLDWGLPKDLLVPYNEQHKPFALGNSYVVYTYLDEYTDRIVASSRLSKHLSEASIYFKAKQAVDLLIWGKSDMGYKAVINNTHLGLIFRDEAFKPLKYGQKMPGFIKDIRPDKKINLSLQLPTHAKESDLEDKIISYIRAHGGHSHITDASPPDLIYREFNVSKKNYKRALSTLYKARKIVINREKISLADGSQ